MGYMPERSSDEKRVLLRYWRSFATPKFKDFLFMVALTDTDWQVRESALSLSRTVPVACGGAG